MLKLYSYFRSSASYRVRIALNHKQLAFDYAAVHLLNDGGQQNSPAYRAINPMGAVPSLEHDGFVVAESMAILQYLDDAFAARPLFPKNAQDKAKVIQICEAVNSGIQPLQNLKVTKALEEKFGMSKDEVKRWAKLWIESGLESLEKLLSKTSGQFAFGDSITAADCFLIPQCFTSRRFEVTPDAYPTIARLEKTCLALDVFQKAHPNNQPDTPPTA